MAKARKKIKTSKKNQVSPFKNYWQRQNYIALGVGLSLLVLGYFLMAQGPWDNPISLTWSPLVLLIAYLIVFPLAIFYKKKKTINENSEDVSGKS